VAGVVTSNESYSSFKQGWVTVLRSEAGVFKFISDYPSRSSFLTLVRYQIVDLEIDRLHLGFLAFNGYFDLFFVLDLI
jgi:hypothetical protein